MHFNHPRPYPACRLCGSVIRLLRKMLSKCRQDAGPTGRPPRSTIVKVAVSGSSVLQEENQADLRGYRVFFLFTGLRACLKMHLV